MNASYILHIQHYTISLILEDCTTIILNICLSAFTGVICIIFLAWYKPRQSGWKETSAVCEQTFRRRV